MSVQLQVVIAVAAVAMVLGLRALARRVTRLRQEGRAEATASCGGQVVLIDDTAAYFGRTSGGVEQRRGNGSLALSDEALVFVQWVPRSVLRIARQDVLAVDHTDEHRGRRLARPLLRVRFGDAGGEDTAAWLVRDLDRWLAAIGGGQPPPAQARTPEPATDRQPPASAH